MKVDLTHREVQYLNKITKLEYENALEDNDGEENEYTRCLKRLKKKLLSHLMTLDKK